MAEFGVSLCSKTIVPAAFKPTGSMIDEIKTMNTKKILNWRDIRIQRMMKSMLVNAVFMESFHLSMLPLLVATITVAEGLGGVGGFSGTKKMVKAGTTE